MANLICSPKSGSGCSCVLWLAELPKPSVDIELLSNGDANTMHHNSHAELITYMDLARIPDEGEPGVVDFAVELFKTLRYAHRERVVRTRVDIPLLICGESTHVQTDVCIVDRSHNDILLLVQTGKRLENMDPDSARAQLVAAAVAAFNENNAQRDALGLQPMEDRVIPGTVMVGASPVFLQIPVTQNLFTPVRHGTYPAQEICVIYCHPQYFA
ncbi:hypothetical protein AB1N83_012714 [Pleurotus pulmonarius]